MDIFCFKPLQGDERKAIEKKGKNGIGLIQN